MVCGSNDISHWGECDGQDVLQCDWCELTFSLPYPTQADLVAKYNDPAWHTDRHYDGSETDGELRARMYYLDVTDLEKVIKPSGVFVDFGCAEGLFDLFLSDKWRSIYVYDLSKAAIKKASEKHRLLPLYSGLKALTPSTVHVIHLRGTLEHMLDPLRFIETATDRLQQGGWLVISNTPNVGSRVARIFRGKYRWILPGEHVNMFTLRTMQVMAAEAGLGIERTIYPYFGTPYAHVMRDLVSIPINLMLHRSSPPWWGDIFTVYMRKI